MPMKSREDAGFAAALLATGLADGFAAATFFSGVFKAAADELLLDFPVVIPATFDLGFGEDFAAIEPDASMN